MTGPSDFTDAELEWLELFEKAGAYPPDEILEKLMESGVVIRIDLVPTITELGRKVLDEAREIGRLPRQM